MNLERKQQIRDEMIAYLGGRLDSFWQDQGNVTTTNSWGEEVTFVVPTHQTAAATERILRSARDRLVLLLLHEGCLDPLRLERFAEPWLKEALALMEEHADAVTADL